MQHKSGGWQLMNVDWLAIIIALVIVTTNQPLLIMAVIVVEQFWLYNKFCCFAFVCLFRYRGLYCVCRYSPLGCLQLAKLCLVVDVSRESSIHKQRKTNSSLVRICQIYTSLNQPKKQSNIICLVFFGLCKPNHLQFGVPDPVRGDERS